MNVGTLLLLFVLWGWGDSSSSTPFCGDLVVRTSEDDEKGCIANKDEGICLKSA